MDDTDTTLDDTDSMRRTDDDHLGFVLRSRTQEGEREDHRRANIVLGVALAIAIGGGAFALGRGTAPASSNSGLPNPSTFAALRNGSSSGRSTSRTGAGSFGGAGAAAGGFGGGFGGSTGTSGSGTSGTVVSVSGNTMVLQVGSGLNAVPVTVKLGSSTAYTKTAKAAKSALTAGQTVTVTGASATDSSGNTTVTASAIKVGN